MPSRGTAERSELASSDCRRVGWSPVTDIKQAQVKVAKLTAEKIQLHTIFFPPENGNTNTFVKEVWDLLDKFGG